MVLMFCSTKEMNKTMFFKLAVMASLLVHSVSAASEGTNFIFNGFQSANLSLDGVAVVTPNGLLKLTNETRQNSGHAFYSHQVNFVNSSYGVSSFSTTFVFAIISEYPKLSGHGIAFAVSPTKGFPGANPSQYLGLFNESNNGNATNHVFAVELDTIQSKEFNDADDNHVGIDINGLKSEEAKTAGFYSDSDGKLRNLTLISGQPMQVWIEYDGINKEINVTLAPINIPKPKTPLLSYSRDLSSVINNNSMFLGFSSSTGSVSTSHYVLGWSFRLNGQAQSLDISRLPKLPRKKQVSKFLTIGLPLISGGIVILVILAIVYVVRRKRKFAELLEDWELDYGPHRFKYKDLYVATNGFKEKELLGSGGFGRVYKGVLPKSKLVIAVKRVSHESRQGMKEFVAEIVSLGRLRHRNLVQLLGYCRRKGELLLVYDYMENGSLDKYLFGEPNPSLNWSQRFQIIKGVASGLLYRSSGCGRGCVLCLEHYQIMASSTTMLSSSLLPARAPTGNRPDGRLCLFQIGSVRTDMRLDLFGSLEPCTFHDGATSCKGEASGQDAIKKRSREAIVSESTGSTVLTPPSEDPSRKHVKLEGSIVSDCESCFLVFDGASKGNPGQAGAGAVLRTHDGSLVCRLREGLGIATNNVAEYRAILLGLKHALQKGFTKIHVQGDSKLVCMQVQGLWKVKNENISELCNEVIKLKDQFISFEISHVLRNLNSEADAQANLAITLADGEVQEFEE